MYITFVERQKGKVVTGTVVRRSIWREATSSKFRWRWWRNSTEFRDTNAIFYLIAYRTYEVNESRGNRVVESDARFNGDDKSLKTHRNRGSRYEASAIRHARAGRWGQTIKRYGGES